MKKTIFLAGVLLLCFACSKDDQEFESIYDVSSDYYFAASIDGVPLIIEVDYENYFNFNFDDRVETTNGFLAYKGSFFEGIEEESGELASVFFMKTFETEPTDCAELSTILTVGQNDYSGMTSFEDLTVSDGVAIHYVDGNGVEWDSASRDGTPSEGNFRVTEITKYKNDPTTCVVKARFNCTLFNEYGTSVELTNGEFSALFSSCKEEEGN